MTHEQRQPPRRVRSAPHWRTTAEKAMDAVGSAYDMYKDYAPYAALAYNALADAVPHMAH